MDRLDNDVPSFSNISFKKSFVGNHVIDPHDTSTKYNYLKVSINWYFVILVPKAAGKLSQTNISGRLFLTKGTHFEAPGMLCRVGCGIS